MKFFYLTKGFGFIVRDDTGQEVFVHKNSVKLPRGKDHLECGDKVLFDVKSTSRTPQAINVVLQDQACPTASSSSSTSSPGPGPVDSSKEISTSSDNLAVAVPPACKVAMSTAHSSHDLPLPLTVTPAKVLPSSNLNDSFSKSVNSIPPTLPERSVLSENSLAPLSLN